MRKVEFSDGLGGGFSLLPARTLEELVYERYILCRKVSLAPLPD